RGLVELSGSRSEFGGQLPRSLALAEAPGPGQGVVDISFSVTNPTQALVSLRLRGRPHFVQVEPASCSLRPGATEKVTVGIRGGAVTRENYKQLEVAAAWTLLAETPEGEASTRSGARSIRVEVPPPPRLFACPAPGRMAL